MAFGRSTGAAAATQESAETQNPAGPVPAGQQPGHLHPTSFMADAELSLETTRHMVGIFLKRSTILCKSLGKRLRPILLPFELKGARKHLVLHFSKKKKHHPKSLKVLRASLATAAVLRPQPHTCPLLLG